MLGSAAHSNNNVRAGQLVFVPSYFDYVRVRNHLRAEAPDTFVGLCEYTEHSDAARGRTYFLQVPRHRKPLLWVHQACWSL